MAAAEAKEMTKILVAGNSDKIDTARQPLDQYSDAKRKTDHTGVVSVSNSSDESSTSGMPDSLQKIVQAQALKVSGVNIANRYHDCNGLYTLDGTAPGFHHHTLPYFRHISSEHYLYQAANAGRWVITTTKDAMKSNNGIIGSVLPTPDPTGAGVKWMHFDVVAKRWRHGPAQMSVAIATKEQVLAARKTPKALKQDVDEKNGADEKNVAAEDIDRMKILHFLDAGKSNKSGSKHGKTEIKEDMAATNVLGASNSGKIDTKRVDDDKKHQEDIPVAKTQVLDLLVIGAGPHALSLLTRLVDDDPDLYTEAERTKIMVKPRSAQHKATVCDHLKKRFDATEALPRTVVVDSNGHWMAQWTNDFTALGIEFLRSHSHMHPGPFNFRALDRWATMKKRQDEIKLMRGIDRKACRRRGYKGPYAVPSTQLFLDFCANLVDRYNLAPLVKRGTVCDVRILKPSPSSATKQARFEVQLVDGRRFFARHVVCAMGPGPAFQAMRITSPLWADELKNSLRQVASKDHHSGSKAINPLVRVQHSAALTRWLLNRKNDRYISGHRVLVIGGGQTAAHLAHQAIRRGASSVTLCSRRAITRKPFDVDIEYVGDQRPCMLSEFHDLKKPRERLEYNADLRGGGSMSEDAYFDLCESSSRLVLLEEATVVQAFWRSSGGSEGEIHVRFDEGSEARFDLVWLATGGNLDLHLMPILASLQKQHPIGCVHGLPVLREDLTWAEGVPLYVMGAFAQLQLGADALNLAGARSGGVIVARGLLESI